MNPTIGTLTDGLESLAYKDLFRDAVLMMAEIARAAGFDPKDENVEPPDIVARVENQRAEVERLTVDLTVARRLLPPRYIAADGSIMDPERCTPHAADCAECGRGRAHDEACLGLAETPAEQVRRLTAGRLAAPDDRHCGSDIYDCEACGFPLDYAITEEGEAANHDGELVCTDCALAYMVDMATGELRRAPALLEAKDAEIARLTAERDALKADLAAAAGELKVPIPEPGTDASRMLLANVLMRRERDAARGDAEERRQPKDTRWFVVHQRDGAPMLDSFIGQGAERAAKLTARFYAAQWTDVYVMTGRPVSSADFEAEATEERAERAADKATS